MISNTIKAFRLFSLKQMENIISEYGLYITKTVYYKVSCGIVVGWVLKAMVDQGSDPAGALCELLHIISYTLKNGVGGGQRRCLHPGWAGVRKEWDTNERKCGIVCTSRKATGISIYLQKQGAGCGDDGGGETFGDGERGLRFAPPPPSDDESSSLTDKTWEPVRLSLCTHAKMTTTLLDRESPSFFLSGGPPQRETRGGGHGERR